MPRLLSTSPRLCRCRLARGMIVPDSGRSSAAPVPAPASHALPPSARFQEAPRGAARPVAAGAGPALVASSGDGGGEMPSSTVPARLQVHVNCAVTPAAASQVSVPTSDHLPPQSTVQVIALFPCCAPFTPPTHPPTLARPLSRPPALLDRTSPPPSCQCPRNPLPSQHHQLDPLGSFALVAGSAERVRKRLWPPPPALAAVSHGLARGDSDGRDALRDTL